jgi:hypothetical protein
MKVCLIEEIFNVEEAANVCGIMAMICLNRQQDQKDWIHTKNDEFYSEMHII